MNGFTERLSLYMPALVDGGVMTFAICLIAIVLGFAFALLLNAMISSRIWLTTALAKSYISFFRGTPVLGQLLMFYYVPSSFGIEISAFTTATLVLALNSASYQSVILKSGFDLIPHGQIEAAQIFSISKFDALIHIKIPQVLRKTLPALISEFIDVIKVSSLVSVISVTEIMRVGQQLVSQTYRPLEVYCIAALFYLLLTTVLSSGGYFIERRWRAAQ